VPENVFSNSNISKQGEKKEKNDDRLDDIFINNY